MNRKCFYHGHRKLWVKPTLGLLPVLVLLAFPALARPTSQPFWSFEAGRAYTIDPNTAQWFLNVRYELPLQSPTLQTRFWLLPEAGLAFPDRTPLYGYGRLQFVTELGLGQAFIDLNLHLPLHHPTSLPTASVRLGLRIGRRHF